ncbi:hypothetical protein H257_16426 [Aphanomyces astaci]|uniref:ADP-ribosylation factor 1 n=1 Tax=Aphanomyces astaci TaxID=112090 RepID=W4FIM7_APHAT|nr:hypothetical protein H257_16426 [Aphanomyces astaci]ETV67345.1 hypothetical protein H257_16426 [Aphanomyces astaci]|eukprot:XP_009843160.1 hypothetical protein H257_16426 [Aphanomyces astaci]
MGSLVSRFLARLFGSNKDVRVLMVGLDAGGKTTILYKLKLGDVVTTIPTLGFNVEAVTYRNLEFTVWDVGTGDKGRGLWCHYFANTHALLYVVDSNDRDRISTARDELHRALADELMQNVHVLVFANKQDLPNAMTTDQVTAALDMEALTRNHRWFVQGCCAPKGDGLYEGLDWVIDTVLQP